jgi:hypothetical protein
MSLRSGTILSAVASLVACTAGPPTPTPPPVRFSQTRLDIAGFETARELPTLSGSVASALTVEVDDPRVASIDSAGKVVGHTSGTTALHPVGGGPPLEIHVTGGKNLKIKAAPTSCRFGEAFKLAADSDGEELDPRNLDWTTTDPSIAFIQDGVLRCGTRTGTAEIGAVWGRARSGISISVEGRHELFSIAPGTASLKVGTIERFEARGPSGPVAIEWTTTPPGLLRPLGFGVFAADKHGRVRLCAKADHTTCTTVEIIR